MNALRHILLSTGLHGAFAGALVLDRATATAIAEAIMSRVFMSPQKPTRRPLSHCKEGTRCPNESCAVCSRPLRGAPRFPERREAFRGARLRRAGGTPVREAWWAVKDSNLRPWD